MTPLQEAHQILLGILQHRRGLILTDTVIRDAAANAATALIPLLESRGDVLKGTINVPSPVEPEVTPAGQRYFDEPPPVRPRIPQTEDEWNEAGKDIK